MNYNIVVISFIIYFFVLIVILFSRPKFLDGFFLMIMKVVVANRLKRKVVTQDMNLILNGIGEY